MRDYSEQAHGPRLHSAAAPLRLPMSDPNRVRVFVASEVRVYRAGLSRLVATEDGLELAGAGKAPECASRFRSSATSS